MDDFNQAVAHHRSGRLEEAAACYQRILQADPVQADAVHGLGVIAYQRRQFESAIELLERAVALRPQSGAFFSNLGLALLAHGQPQEAVRALRRAVELLPQAAETHYNLANAFKTLKQATEAEAEYRRALELNPAHAQAHNNLGNLLCELGQFDEAESCLRRALQIAPQFAEGYVNLGNVLREQGNAVAAEGACRQALALRPDFAIAWNGLGNALRDQRNRGGAIDCYRRALEFSPSLAEAESNLGLILQVDGRFSEAIAAFRRAVGLCPTDADKQSSLANALLSARELAEGDACYQRALELQPDAAQIQSSVLLWSQYRPNVTLESLAAAHREWDRRHGGQPQVTVAVRRADPLRLGFVSADFGRHAVGYFCVRALEALAAAGCELCCYSNLPRGDDLNGRFRAAAHTWRDIRHLSDAAAAQAIAADGVDVLFDLSGHTAGNRLPVFAHKPAPIQITWIGSEGTTGLSAMDYILADERLIPTSHASYYQEAVLRLPETYVCYDPPREAPAVGPLPVLRRGQITFGSFNNPAKLHAGVVRAWAEILRRVDSSRLLLKYNGLTDPALRQWVISHFAKQGIPKDRLDIRGWSPHAEMLAQYNEVDLALDTFPFGGGATTCEALWMGVPVVTLPGETFAGRHSLSYLSAIGCTGTIAPDLNSYVELAVSLALDPQRLAGLRSELRERMASSPLCNGPRFAEHFVAALRPLVDAQRSAF